MKIGVISDTHIPVSAKALPGTVVERFKECDLIIHAGDAIEMSVIRDLEKLAETKAVWGNMDDSDVKRELPETIIFEAEGKTIGVVHGRGPGFRVRDSVDGYFKTKPDIIIFGHSHNPVNEEKNGTLYFNPGSATDTVFSKFRSFGIIEIKDGQVTAEIIKIDG